MSEMSKPFQAKYDGRCMAECDEPIQVGELVVYVGTALVHEGCALSSIQPYSDEQRAATRRDNTRFQGTSLDEMGF